MKSPTNELQQAIVQTLRNDPDVKAIIEDRVFDRVPEEPVFPYVSIGPTDITNTMADCFNIEDITIQLDAWSRDYGFVELRELSSAVRRALHDKDFDLENNAAILFVHTVTREYRDPDGITTHAPMTFTASVQRR